ncbi:MAG: GntR family transcriptional regulator [Candidatus Velthaea sp.]
MDERFAIAAVENIALSDRVVVRIRDGIVAGRLPTDRWLPIAHLASAMGVSSTPVRAALARLENEGLIEVAKARGFRIIPMTRADVTDVYLVNQFLAGEFAARAALVRDATMIAECERLDREMNDVVEGRSTADIDVLNSAFHRTINKAAHALRLERVLRNTVRSVPHAFHEMVPNWKILAMAQHRAMLDAIRRGDSDAARTAAANHIAHGCELLLAQLERIGYWDAGSRIEPPFHTQNL